MNSISYYASFWLVENGLVVTGQTITNPLGLSPENRAKRQDGDIKGFSSASRLRFRKLLATAKPTFEGYAVGFCFTIPGEIITQERASHLWHSWSRNQCRRDFAELPFIWRVELQKRKQPHWHLVTWIPKNNPLLIEQIKEAWKHLVLNSLKPTLTERQHYGFDEKGVQHQRLSGTESAAKYLAPTLDHETKHKQDQLGWIGRQWGIINRDRLTFECKADQRLTLCGDIVRRVLYRFKAAQEERRAKGTEYVGPGVGEHSRFPSVLFGGDSSTLETIIREEREKELGSNAN